MDPFCFSQKLRVGYGPEFSSSSLSSLVFLLLFLHFCLRLDTYIAMFQGSINEIAS